MRQIGRTKEKSTLGKDSIVVGFSLFAMFFGAGNLIFPPVRWGAGGRCHLPAIIGSSSRRSAFRFSACSPSRSRVASTSSPVVCPRRSPRCSAWRSCSPSARASPSHARDHVIRDDGGAIPASRTGWGGWTTQLAYSLVFFAVAFLLAQHPEKLSAVLGRFMGPLLLAFIAVLFIACLAHGAVTPTQPTGDYAVHQASRGFLDGYQTMDLLAALYFGIVISANVRAMHVTDNTLIRRETAYAGLGTGILLIVIYAVLGYVGVVSGSIASVNPTADTGATVLTNLTASLFGTFGMVFLGIVFVIACLNVCTGLICTCATYFHTRFATVAGRRVSYRAWQALFTVFSFVVSNAGLSMIIKVSVPCSPHCIRLPSCW